MQISGEELTFRFHLFNPIFIESSPLIFSLFAFTLRYNDLFSIYNLPLLLLSPSLPLFPVSPLILFLVNKILIFEEAYTYAWLKIPKT